MEPTPELLALMGRVMNAAPQLLAAALVGLWIYARALHRKLNEQRRAAAFMAWAIVQICRPAERADERAWPPLSLLERMAKDWAKRLDPKREEAIDLEDR